jgi:prepilin-type N-terminal cleavage/methylation domain-containing protein
MKPKRTEKDLDIRNRRASAFAGCVAGMEKGFTLIEVLVAMVLLLIGMLGVIGMQYYAISGNSASREIKVAVNLAHQLTEQMKATPYASLASSTDTPALDPSMRGSMSNLTRRWWVQPDCFALALDDGGNGDNGSCSVNLNAGCPGGDPDTAVPVATSAIRIRTCWQDRDGLNRSVTLDTVRWNENVVP